MNSLQSQKYESLRQRFIDKEKIFNIKEKELRNDLFKQENALLNLYEFELKEKFLSIWKEHGNKDYTFENLKFNLNPLTWHNYVTVMTLSKTDEKLDLQSIALGFPEEIRKETYLIKNFNYAQTSEKIKEELENLELSSGWSKIKSIGEFQEEFNILLFHPGYFEVK